MGTMPELTITKQLMHLINIYQSISNLTTLSALFMLHHHKQNLHSTQNKTLNAIDVSHYNGVD